RETPALVVARFRIMPAKGLTPVSIEVLCRRRPAARPDQRFGAYVWSPRPPPWFWPHCSKWLPFRVARRARLASFRLGALAIKLACRCLADGLRGSAPPTRPLDGAVDQRRQQQQRTNDLHDGEQRHRLNGV